MMVKMICIVNYNRLYRILRKIMGNKIEKTSKYFTHFFKTADFDDMSSFFPCEIDDAIQYINLAYGAQAPKIVIL